MVIKTEFQSQRRKWQPTGEGNGNPLQYSCLENPMDRGAWWAAVHGVAKSRTRLSDFPSLPASEKTVVDIIWGLHLWILSSL